MPPNQIENHVIIEKKRHYVGSIIFFVIILVLHLIAGLVTNFLTSKIFIIGAVIFSLLLTAVFSLIAYIIRKIAVRFGKKSSILSWVLVFVLLVSIGGYIYQKNNISGVTTLETLSFQSYNKDNFLQYDQAKHYSVKYPKGWAVYQVSGQDTSADALLLVPQDVADKYIKTPPEKMLNGSEAYTIKEAARKDNQQIIEVGAAFQYSGYVPPADHENYLKSVVRSAEKRDRENSLNTKMQVVIFKDVPRIYSTFDYTENNITTKYVSVSWFVKPDSQGRDKSAAPVLVGVSYTTTPENFSEEIFNGVVDSVDEHFWETYFDARS